MKTIFATLAVAAMLLGSANAAQTIVTDQSGNHDGGVTVPDGDGKGDGKGNKGSDRGGKGQGGGFGRD